MKPCRTPGARTWRPCRLKQHLCYLRFLPLQFLRRLPQEPLQLARRLQGEVEAEAEVEQLLPLLQLLLLLHLELLQHEAVDEGEQLRLQGEEEGEGAAAGEWVRAHARILQVLA